MIIEQLSLSKVLISLCNEDIESFQLDFDKMGLSDERSRKVLLRLLQIACRKTGVSCKSKKVMIEALPHEQGCLLLVTVMDKKAKKVYKVKRIFESLVYEFADAENLLCAAETAHQRNITFCRNSLWLYDNKYYLVLSYPSMNSRARSFIKEYAAEVYATSAQMSRIREGGKILYDGDVLEMIGRKMNKLSR